MAGALELLRAVRSAADHDRGAPLQAIADELGDEVVDLEGRLRVFVRGGRVVLAGGRYDLSAEGREFLAGHDG